jgi:recombination protein RecT
MSTAVAIRTELANFLTTNKDQIQAALPKHLNADRMSRLALTAFSQNKALQDCRLETIFASVVIASQLGLEIGVAGQGFLVPYKGTCTFVPGWQGLVDLVARSGRATVWTGAVHEGDDFDWALGDRPYVKHRPKNRTPGASPIYTYAIGRAKGSEWPVVEVWDADALIAHRDKYNKVGDRHYSFKNWEMYARKVPLLQVIKYLPKSIELANAIQLEAAAATGGIATLEGDYVRVDDPEGDAPGDPAAEASAKVEQPKAADAPKAGEAREFKAMLDGQKKIIRAKLKNAKLDEKALTAKFGKSLDDEGVKGFDFNDFASIQKWIADGGKE